MLREARDWAEVAANVVVKLPATRRGPRGGARLRRRADPDRRRDAARRPEQALLAARAGAAYVSAPVGRAGGVDGNDVIRKLVALFKTYGVSTEVVAGAIRIPTDVIDAALAGAHAAAAPAAVLRELDAESTRQADWATPGAAADDADPPARQPAQVGSARDRGRAARRGGAGAARWRSSWGRRRRTS